MKVQQKVRSKVLPRIDKYSREYLGLYTAYQVTMDEFVFESGESTEKVARGVREIGYEYNSLSATKKHPDTEKVDSGSFRRVPQEHPDSLSSKSRLFQEWDAEDCQYHIHIFESDNSGSEIFCHYELRPDLYRPNFSINRIRTHYRPEWNETYFPNIHDDRVENLGKDL